MCWPELVGSVDVEERRPRTWNEPRRQRLNFVRGHQRHSDEWMSTPRRLTEREIWDYRRAREMEQQRLMHLPPPHFQGPQDPRMIQLPPDQQQQHHTQPGHHGQQAQLDRRSHHSDEDIIEIEDLGHDGHDGDDDLHPKPHIVCVKPTKSRLPKGVKVYAMKSGGHKKKYSISSFPSDDSSSSDDDSGFSEGFRAGRRSLSRRPGRRGRSRSRLTNDSFEDLMEPQLRSRSRRGRR